jgi:hypothetical protein
MLRERMPSQVSRPIAGMFFKMQSCLYKVLLSRDSEDFLIIYIMKAQMLKATYRRIGTSFQGRCECADLGR